MQRFAIDAADLEALLRDAWEFALPRLLQSALVLVGLALLYVVARWILGRVERWFDRTETEIDDKIAALVRRVALLSIGFWALWQLAQVWELGYTARVVGAVWIVALAFPLGRFVTDVLEIFERRIAPRTQTSLDDTALPLLNKMARFLVVAVGVLVALQTLGIAITPVLAGAGVAGLAISLAAKDTLSNLIAGVLLILDRPFQVGDRIELWSAPAEGGQWGDVIEIGLRATKIRNPDNVVIVIPNNEIMRRDIINYTASGNHIRLRIPIGIAYDADAGLAKELVLRAIEGLPGTKSDPSPVVIVRGFEDSAVDLEARVWIDDARQRRAIADVVTARVKQLFDEHGVEIPYPKRDLYVKTFPGELAAPGREGGNAGRQQPDEEEILQAQQDRPPQREEPR